MRDRGLRTVAIGLAAFDSLIAVLLVTYTHEGSGLYSTGIDLLIAAPAVTALALAIGAGMVASTAPTRSRRLAASGVVLGLGWWARSSS